jgi:HPt (histidine-containing phosphotransfer) domain-containing protein
VAFEGKMPNPALEPDVPGVIEAATFQEGDGVGRKNPTDSGPEISAAVLLPWDPQQTLERLGGDEKLLQEVMEIFLQEVPKHLAGLREAITQQQAETAERIAHSLQGELGYLGIAELSQGARDLEEKGRTADFQGALILLPHFEAAMARLLSSMGVTQKIGPEEPLTPGSPGVSP